MVDQYYNAITAHYQSIGIDRSFLALNSITSEEANTIGQLIMRCQPAMILEVGTSLGISTAVMGFSTSLHTRIITVDPNLLLQQDAFDHPRNAIVPVLQLTDQMLKHFDLRGRVHMLEGYFSCFPSRQQEHFLGGNHIQEVQHVVGHAIKEWAPYDFAFIDGEHFTCAVLSDLLLVDQYLSDTATIVLHDVDYYWGKFVRSAVDTFMSARDHYTFEMHANLGFLKRSF